MAMDFVGSNCLASAPVADQNHCNHFAMVKL